MHLRIGLCKLAHISAIDTRENLSLRLLAIVQCYIMRVTRKTIDSMRPAILVDDDTLSNRQLGHASRFSDHQPEVITRRHGGSHFYSLGKLYSETCREEDHESPMNTKSFSS